MAPRTKAVPPVRGDLHPTDSSFMTGPVAAIGNGDAETLLEAVSEVNRPTAAGPSSPRSVPACRL